LWIHRKLVQAYMKLILLGVTLYILPSVNFS